MGRPSTIRPALKKFNSNPRKALADLYRTRTLRQVANKLGVDSATVQKTMVRFGIRRRAQKTPAPQGRLEVALAQRGQANGETARKVFIRLYQTEGMTLQRIADQFGATREGVRSLAVRFGVQLRRRGIRKGIRTSRRSSRSYDLSGCL